MAQLNDELPDFNKYYWSNCLCGIAGIKAPIRSLNLGTDMCGFSAIVNVGTAPSKGALQIVSKMNELLRHRGPDFSSVACPSIRVAFAHSRLSILDLSDLGNQPMEKHGLTIAYNGEIYNYVEIRDELLRKGYRFKSNSDTEVCLSAYDLWGSECLNRFNGMWAFVIYDQETGRLFIARDRFGKKPLYYTKVDDSYYFASELKAFQAIEGFHFKLNKKVAYEYLAHGYEDRTNESFVENIRVFPPGNFGYLDTKPGSEIVVSEYFNIEKEGFQLSEIDVSFAEAKSKIRELLFDSVKLRLRADVNVAASLSGGIDSSIVTACAETILRSANAKDRLHTFSSLYTGFDSKGVNEAKYAFAVNSLYRLHATTVTPDAEGFLQNLDRLVYIQDEPFLSAGMFAQFKVYEAMNKNGIKVSLDGQGVDEAIGGYFDYNSIYLRHLWQKRSPRFLVELASFVRRYPAHVLSMGLKKMRLTTTKSVEILSDRFEGEFGSSPVFVAREGIRSASILQLKSLFLPAFLQHQDRNSMAFGIESRSPFMDFRVVSFLLNLPDTYKIKNGVRKHILREAFKDMLPSCVYHRIDKLGFPAPANVWIQRHPLAFKKLINESMDTGLFTIELLELFNRQPKVGYRDYLKLIRAIIISRWISIFGVKC
jgi:asparagine synthase (glutamine-hydrolysing)